MKAWLIAAGLSWGFMGVCNLFAKLASDHLPGTSVAVWWSAGYLPLTLGLVALIGFPRQFDRASASYSFLAGVVGQLAALAFYIALADGMVSTVTTIAYLYPLITLMLARFTLHDKLNRRQLAGVFFAVTALFMFGMGA